MPSRRPVLLGLVSFAIAAYTEGVLPGGGGSDESFYARYCRNLGHADGSTAYDTCVSDKRREIERERRRQVRPDFF